jgi:hypothetical protein
MDKLKNLIVTQGEFSFLVSSSTRTIRTKIVEGMPSLGRKGIPFVEAFRWWMENVLGAGDVETLTDLKKENMKIQNELKRIELLLQKGELIQRAEVVANVGFIIIQTKHRFLQLNRTLPPQLYGRDEREWAGIIKKETRQIIENFYQAMKKIGKYVPRRGH